MVGETSLNSTVLSKIEPTIHDCTSGRCVFYLPPMKSFLVQKCRWLKNVFFWGGGGGEEVSFLNLLKGLEKPFSRFDFFKSGFRLSKHLRILQKLRKCRKCLEAQSDTVATSSVRFMHPKCFRDVWKVRPVISPYSPESSRNTFATFSTSAFDPPWFRP